MAVSLINQGNKLKGEGVPSGTPHPAQDSFKEWNFKVKKIFIKSVIISFAVWYAVFSVSMPVLVWAEETETTQTETINSTGDSQETTSSSEPTPTPTPEPTNIETGNADSSATAQNDANSAETQVPGSLEGEGCGPETTCPQDTTVDTEQEATTETTSSSTSETGENEATTSGDLTIDTGDATSQATSDSQANTNVVELEEPSPSPEPTASPELAPASSSTPEASLDVETTQEATTSAVSEALSETGENIGLTESQLEIITGFAVAIATALNMANINLVGSDLIWLIETILGSEEETINFYELLQNLPSQEAGEIPQDTTITTEQTSELLSQTQATSDTGNNTGEAETVEMQTGDAVSLANTVNLTNLNLVGSKGIFTIINIVGSLLGDIIFPNSSHLLPANFPWGNTQIITTQQASIDSSSDSRANTGENNFEGEGELSTRDATAISNTSSFANLVRVGNGWALLFINLFGGWTGSLINWDAPGAQSSLGYGTHVLEKDWEVPQDQRVENENEDGGSLTVVTDQSANVQSTTGASSNTGQNLLRGRGRLLTGNAFSLANDFTLANFVGVGGSFIFGILNILGSWTGNLIVAYPDLEISVSDGLSEITPGSESQYTVVVTNRGAAWAREVYANLSFQGEYLPGDGFSGGWGGGDLGPGESRSYAVAGTVSPTALSGAEILASAQVENHETEESTTNNTAVDSTIIVLPPSEPESGTETGIKDTRLPTLAVSVWHNVGEFVYPGDTVLASITVANQSPFPAHDVKVEGSLSNDHPMPPIPMSWNLGNLRAGERVKIEFQINLINEIPDGMYHLAAQAKGKSEAGEEASSDWVVSDFLVRLKNIAKILTPEILALESNQGVPSAETLGVGEERGGFDIRRYFLYILAASIPTLLALSALRRKINGGSFFPAFLLWKRRKNEKN